MAKRFFGNLIFASALGMGITSIYAGGEEVAVPTSNSFFYIEANAAYVDSNWYHVSGFVRPFIPNTGNARNGFGFGFDGGYEFNQYFGAELGWYYLPRASAQGSGLLPFGVGNLSTNSWFGYGAGKITVPIFAFMDVFGKVGAAYRNVNYSGPAAPIFSGFSYWTPFFGVGAQFGWNSWSLNAQYQRVPGFHQANPVTRRVPAANLYSIGLGYRFSF